MKYVCRGCACVTWNMIIHIIRFDISCAKHTKACTKHFRGRCPFRPTKCFAVCFVYLLAQRSAASLVAAVFCFCFVFFLSRIALLSFRTNDMKAIFKICISTHRRFAENVPIRIYSFLLHTRSLAFSTFVSNERATNSNRNSYFAYGKLIISMDFWIALFLCVVLDSRILYNRLAITEHEHRTICQLPAPSTFDTLVIVCAPCLRRNFPFSIEVMMTTDNNWVLSAVAGRIFEPNIKRRKWWVRAQELFSSLLFFFRFRFATGVQSILRRKKHGYCSVAFADMIPNCTRMNISVQ